MSSSSASSPTASASPSASASASLHAGSNLKIVGIILAVCSGILIGSSFVFKKKGLLRSQVGHEAGEGVRYLKSPLWWTGMIMMILGELCNFAAYAFIEALVVTPLGALSVVICAILSSLFLNEKLTFFGWLGCGLSIVGSIIIALNGPQEQSVGEITEFQKLFLAPGFLAFGGTLIAASLIIIFYFAPKYGKQSMLWYISVCSMIGGISVSVTTGLGAAIVTTAMGDNQFKHWFIYFLIVFVVVTLITEVYYLNVALALFNTAMVTPTYYVIFSFCSMITTVVLFQGLKASATQILTIVMGFLVICTGVVILQMSKVDPTQFKKLDRKSTILLQAARNTTEKVEEKDITAFEDPGMDAIRGSSGVIGSIIRARSARRLSQSRSANSVRSRPGTGLPLPGTLRDGLQRHQLYDAPMPSPGLGSERGSIVSSPPPKSSIRFEDQDVIHTYQPTSAGAATATHAQREAARHLASSLNTPSTPNMPSLSTVVEGEEPLSQILTIPPYTSADGVNSRGPHTAPPTIFTDNIPRTQLRDPFEESPATAFTESSQYSGYRDEEEQPAWKYSRRREGRLPSERGYPLTAGDDDKDESISLVNRSSFDDDYDDDNVKQGGIRLVAPSPRT